MPVRRRHRARGDGSGQPRAHRGRSAPRLQRRGRAPAVRRGRLDARRPSVPGGVPRGRAGRRRDPDGDHRPQRSATLEAELDLRAEVCACGCGDARRRRSSPRSIRREWPWTLERALGSRAPAEARLRSSPARTAGKRRRRRGRRDAGLEFELLSPREAIRAFAARPETSTPSRATRPPRPARGARVVRRRGACSPGAASPKRALASSGQPRHGLRHRRPGRRRPGLDAARGVADAR